MVIGEVRLQIGQALPNLERFLPRWFVKRRVATLPDEAPLKAERKIWILCGIYFLLAFCSLMARAADSLSQEFRY